MKDLEAPHMTGAGAITARRWEGFLFRWKVDGQFWRESQMLAVDTKPTARVGVSDRCRWGQHADCGGGGRVAGTLCACTECDHEYAGNPW